MTQKRGHILVVDDNRMNRLRLLRELEQQGHAVAITENGREALDALRTLSFDLVLLDVMMPELDGCQVLAQMKDDPALADIPVIVISGLEEIDRVIKCIELGAEDYLLQPFDPILLKARIGGSLEKKRLRDLEWRHLKQLEKLSDDLQQVILPLGIALSVEKDLDRLLERILVETKRLCNADAGTLYLRDEADHLCFAIMRTTSLKIALGGTTGQPIPFAALPLYHPASGEPNHNNVATLTALYGDAINIPNIYAAQDFDFSATRSFDQANGYRSISTLTVPLKDHTGQVIGVLQLINALEPITGQVIAFNSYHQTVVESLASQAAVALNIQMLLERQQELVKFEHDLKIGRQIQYDFLPKQAGFPRPDGWDIAACFQPAHEVAGDFYDVFPLARGRIGLVIADVCDKGVGSALFMALSRSLIRAVAKQRDAMSHPNSHSPDPTVIVRPGPTEAQPMILPEDTGALLAGKFTNDYIANNHGDMNMFTTLFFGVLNPATSILSYINGGHNPPVIVGPTGLIKAHLMPTGPLVGIFPDVDFGIKSVTLEPGDLLLTFTDGVLDARDLEDELFGEERLLSLVAEPASSVAALLDRIMADLHAHIGEADQFDDITMLAVRRAATDEATRCEEEVK